MYTKYFIKYKYKYKLPTYSVKHSDDNPSVEFGQGQSLDGLEERMYPLVRCFSRDIFSDRVESVNERFQRLPMRFEVTLVQNLFQFEEKEFEKFLAQDRGTMKLE
jgi:hypothetical protein